MRMASHLLIPALLLGASVSFAGESAKFEPPPGRVFHGWGQFSHGWNTDMPGAAGDEGDFKVYLQAVGDNRPAIVSFYAYPEEKDGGFQRHYRQFAQQHPWSMALIAFEFDAKAITAGDNDVQLREFFGTLKEVGWPVFLRPGWEFNNPGRFEDPELYKAAFRHIAQLIKETDAANVATVWHASPPVPDPHFQAKPVMPFYPGDDVVDWWGISLFSESSFRAPETIAFYEEAKRHGKPILVGESSPLFRTADMSAGDVFRDPVSAEESVNWYQSYFRLFDEYPQLKGFCLIVVDWERWDWIFSFIPGGFAANARLDIWPGLIENYQQWISTPRYLHAREAEKLFGGSESRGDRQ